jgi:hypothetical protein
MIINSLNRPRRVAPQSLSQIFAVPGIVLAATLTGLIAGLTGDGWRDTAASLLLFIPVSLAAYHWWRR